MTVPDWKRDILEHLDRAAAGFMLPGLPAEGFFPASQRLTAFRSDNEWLLVFEIVTYNEPAYALDLVVYAFGNRIERQWLQHSEAVVMRSDGTDPWDGDTFGLDLDQLEVAVHGNVHSLRPTDEEKHAACVTGGEDEMPEPARVIRLIAHLLDDKMFFPAERLLDICGRADAGLEHLLTLRTWEQPEVGTGRFEVPSDMAGLRSLAEAVALGDADAYHSPESTHDVDWWNWEE